MYTWMRLKDPAAALVLAACGVLLPLAATAHGVVVPDQFPTIQEAIDSPHSGSIVVRGGTYAPFSVVGQRGLQIFGVEGAKVIVDGSGASTPISVRDAERVFIWGFTVRDSADALVEIIDSRDVGIALLKLKAGGGPGVSIEGSREVQIVENRVLGTGGSCIQLVRNEDNRASNQGWVSKNRLSDCGGDGISINGNDAKIEKNRIAGVAGTGISLEAGVGHRVRNNRVKRADGVGILVDTDRVVVKDNVVRNALGDSYRVEGTAVRLKKNEARDPAECGLRDLADEGVNDYRKNEFVTTCFGASP